MICRIRKREVKATQEELVRQHVLNHLIDDLLYPPHLISVEKELKHFSEKAPKRRLDILVFTLLDGELKPFLLVECKATPLSDDVERQVAGYNHFVGAPFVSIVNHEKVLSWSLSGTNQVLLNEFPPYIIENLI